jgi:hypothetical protein
MEPTAHRRIWCMMLWHADGCRWHLIKRGCYAGGVVSGGLSLVTLLTKTSVIRGLTDDPAVRAACLAVFPWVMVCQVSRMCVSDWIALPSGL